MEDNKRDYGDFFRTGDSGGSPKEERIEKTERPSYYYSYGPFKSSMGEEQPETTTVTSEQGTSSVEISAPRPVRPYYGYANDNDKPALQQTSGQWDFNNAKKRTSSFKSYVATFLAGALVVSSLMFASDKMNLFSDANALTGGNGSVPGSTVTANGTGGSGGVTTAAFDGVVRPGNIAEIVNQASPAVVKINTYVKPSNRSRGGSIFDTDDIFNWFFGTPRQTPRQNPNGEPQRQQAGMGSGFIFDKEGYILTNEHVINGADEIEVEVLGYTKPFKAKLLGSEFSLDLAVLKIEPDGDKPFSTLALGSSDDIRVGDWVVAIGNPYGFDHTVTVGVLSAKERDIPIPDRQGRRDYKHLLQTDASINPGNSGGPLLNLNGQVIGINTAVNAEAQGIGFAIPTSTVVSVLENLKKGIKIPIPYMGVGLRDIEKDWVQQLQLENTDGSVITQVESGSPADKAGLMPGDVIIEINGSAVKNSEEVTKKVQAMKVGDKANLKIVRDGKKMDVFVIIGDRNKAQ